MITIDIFLIGLMIVSTLTGLVTEAIKRILNELKVTYYSNLLSGIVSVILSAGTGICYIIFSGVGFTAQSIVCLVVLAFAGWLCSMLGYDKIVQVITQFKNIKKG